MAEQTLRWGVLGCADIAIRSVIPGIQASRTGQVVAIASRDEEKATHAARQFCIPRAYGSYDALLRDDAVEAVYIPLPNHLHKTWTIRAAQAGKHVLCEKPIALNAAEAEEMAYTCQRAGVHLAEAFMYRYHPRYKRIAEIIQSGEIGDVRSVRGAFTFNNADDLTNVRFQRVMGGGSIYDVGCYPISAARLILGTEPEAVAAYALFSPDHDGVDMAASALLEFPNHIGVTFDCGMWAEPQNTLQVVGTRGRIEVPNAFVGDDRFHVVVNGTRRDEVTQTVNQYALQADHFAERVFTGQFAGMRTSVEIGRAHEDGATVDFSPQDAVRNMRVIDACLASARSRLRVPL